MDDEGLAGRGDMISGKSKALIVWFLVTQQIVKTMHFKCKNKIKTKFEFRGLERSNPNQLERPGREGKDMVFHKDMK